MPIGRNLFKLKRAFEGQVATVNGFRSILGTFEEFCNAESSYLPFGRLVVRDSTDPTKVALPSAAGQNILGVAPLNDRFEALTDNPRVTGFPPNETVPVLNEGTVYLVPETNLTRGGSLFVRHTANGALDQLGSIRADPDGRNADPLPAGSYRVLEDAVAGEVTPIKFSFSKTL